MNATLVHVAQPQLRDQLYISLMPLDYCILTFPFDLDGQAFMSYDAVGIFMKSKIAQSAEGI